MKIVWTSILELVQNYLTPTNRTELFEGKNTFEVILSNTLCSKNIPDEIFVDNTRERQLTSFLCNKNNNQKQNCKIYVSILFKILQTKLHKIQFRNAQYINDDCLFSLALE